MTSRCNPIPDPSINGDIQPLSKNRGAAPCSIARVRPAEAGAAFICEAPKISYYIQGRHDGAREGGKRLNLRPGPFDFLF